MIKQTMRVMACSAVCIVVLSTVGHAFGFFSASSATSGTEWHTGSVSLNVEEPPEGGVRALEWTGLYPAHVALEQESHRIAMGGGPDRGAVQHALDANFSAWWREHEENLGGFLRECAVASPGGFLVTQYAFVNQSTLPVYLRIEKPQVGPTDNAQTAPDAAVLAWASGADPGQARWVYDSAQDRLLADAGPGDGYLYLEQPLGPGQRVRVTCAAYITSQSGGGLPSTSEAVLFVGAAELIQAQNNAVYLDDGWRLAADNGVAFVPYTETIG